MGGGSARTRPLWDVACPSGSRGWPVVPPRLALGEGLRSFGRDMMTVELELLGLELSKHSTRGRRHRRAAPLHAGPPEARAARPARPSCAVVVGSTEELEAGTVERK